MAQDEKLAEGLHHSYVRLRTLIPGAFDTPHAPEPEQIWETTEAALSRLVTLHEASQVVINHLLIAAQYKRECRHSMFHFALERVWTKLAEYLDSKDGLTKRGYWKDSDLVQMLCRISYERGVLQGSAYTIMKKIYDVGYMPDSRNDIKAFLDMYDKPLPK